MTVSRVLGRPSDKPSSRRATVEVMIRQGRGLKIMDKNMLSKWRYNFS